MSNQHEKFKKIITEETLILEMQKIHPSQYGNNKDYYLFKKFLVSDWLTANCEIVISTQWRTKYSKMASKSQYEKILDAFAPYYYDDENHIDSLTPLI